MSEEHEKEVAELEKALAAARVKAAYVEYPKWVKVHESHISHTDDPTVADHISVAAFPHHHVARGGVVTVLVMDDKEEAKAIGVA